MGFFSKHGSTVAVIYGPALTVIILLLLAENISEIYKLSGIILIVLFSTIFILILFIDYSMEEHKENYHGVKPKK